MSDTLQRFNAQYVRDMSWMSEMCGALTDHAAHIDRHANIVRDTATQSVGTRKVVSDNDKNMKEILEDHDRNAKAIIEDNDVTTKRIIEQNDVATKAELKANDAALKANLEYTNGRITVVLEQAQKFEQDIEAQKNVQYKTAEMMHKMGAASGSEETMKQTTEQTRIFAADMLRMQ